MGSIVELREVTVIYRGQGIPQRALDSVSISFKHRGSIGILGRSGSGKSTLAKVAVGIIKPLRGEVLFRGKKLWSLSRGEAREFRRSVQLVLQDPYESLDPEALVYHAIIEGLKINKAARPHIEIRNLLEILGLDRLAHKRISQLSGGERQRVAIARALAVGPELVIFDEPTSMLDSIYRREIIELICGLREKFNISIAIITHNIIDLACVEEIAIMKDGKIIARGSYDELSKSEDDYISMLLKGLKDL